MATATRTTTTTTIERATTTSTSQLVERHISRRVARPEQVATTIKQKYIQPGIAVREEGGRAGQGRGVGHCHVGGRVVVCFRGFILVATLARNGRRMSVNFAL